LPEGLGSQKVYSSGIFGKSPERARRLIKSPLDSGKLLPFDCRDDNLEEGE